MIKIARCSCCFHPEPEPFTPVSLPTADLSKSSSSMATANTMHPVCNTTVAGSAFNNGTITGANEDLQTQPSFENHHQLKQFQRGDPLRYESNINFQAELENFLREFPPQSNYHEPQNQQSNYVRPSQSEQSNIQLSQDQHSNLECLPQNQQSNFIQFPQNQPSSSLRVLQNQSSAHNHISNGNWQIPLQNQIQQFQGKENRLEILGQRNSKRGASVDCFIPQQQRPRLQQIHPLQGPFNHQPKFSSSKFEYHPQPGPHEQQLLIENKHQILHYVPALPIQQTFPQHGETYYVQPLREINIEIPQQVDSRLMALYPQPSTSFQPTLNISQTHQSSLPLQQEQMPHATVQHGSQSFQPRLQLERQQEPHTSQQWVQARMPPSSQSRPHQQMPQSSQSRPHQQMPQSSESRPHQQMPHSSQSRPHQQMPQSSESRPHPQMPQSSQSRPYQQIPQSSQSRPYQQMPQSSQSRPYQQMPQSSQSRPHQQIPQSSRSRTQQASQPYYYRQAPLEEELLRSDLLTSPERRLQRDRRQLLEDFFKQYAHSHIVPFDRYMPPSTLGLGGLQEVPKVPLPAKNTEPELKLVLQQNEKKDELDVEDELEYEPKGTGYFRIYHIYDAGYLSPLDKSEFHPEVADRLHKGIKNLLEKNYYFERHFNIVLSRQIWNISDSDESGISKTDEEYYLTFSCDKIAKYLLSFNGKYNEVPPEDGIFSKMLPRAYSREGPEQALSPDDIENKNFS